MTTTHLDSELAAYLKEANEVGAVAHNWSPDKVRANFQAMRNYPVDVAEMHKVSDYNIPAPHGNIACRMYKPTADHNMPLLVWFHGGGWVLGDLDQADFTCRELAALSKCAVLSVDYRLAPEAPFPAAFDDCLMALQWVVDNSDSIGINKNRMAIGGDSAGANLATCVAIAARDLNLAINFQLLIYPVVEPDFDKQSYIDNAEGYGLTTNMMKWFWDHYTPDPIQRSDPRVAPLNASLDNLPPAWVLTAGFDPLRDEGVNYAKALAAADVDVSTAQVDNAIHGFFTMPVKCAAKARSEAAKQLIKALVG